VADIGLDRADRTRVAAGARSAEDAAERQAFDAIPGGGASAMRLDAAQQLFPRRRIGQGDAFGPAVGIHARAEDLRVDRIAVGQRRWPAV
jgi:hypothetical protein